MNWTCVVYGGVMMIVLVWYAVDARKWFRGPKVFDQTKTLLRNRLMWSIICWIGQLSRKQTLCRRAVNLYKKRM